MPGQIQGKKRVVHQKAKGPIDPSVGLKVRELRTERKMTQAKLAGSDFSKGFISLLETGRTRISLRAAHILASRLGVDVSEFVAGTTPVQKVQPLSDLSPEANKIREKIRERRATQIRSASVDDEIERMLTGILRTHQFDATRIEELEGLLKELPDPDKFGPEQHAQLQLAIIAWREKAWLILNRQERKKR